MSSNNEKGCHGHGRRRFWKIPFIVAAIILIKSGLVMLLWNALIPDLFHGPVLDFCQALGLTVLVKVLVGFGGGGFRHWGGRHRFGGHHGPPWGRDRWANLSPEEREKLREEVGKRCGWKKP